MHSLSKFMVMVLGSQVCVCVCVCEPQSSPTRNHHSPCRPLPLSRPELLSGTVHGNDNRNMPWHESSQLGSRRKDPREITRERERRGHCD